MRRVPFENHPQLVFEMEKLFFQSENWRVAQHLSLLHLGRFSSGTGKIDVLRSLFFAEQACTISGDHPLAVVAMARVYWERRIAEAVILCVGELKKKGLQRKLWVTEQRRKGEQAASGVSSASACRVIFHL